MRFLITHQTVYSGSEPVSVCHNQAWLHPRELAHQSCEEFKLDISPLPSTHSHRVDQFGNQVELFSFNEGYNTLTVNAKSKVEVREQLQLPQSSNSWQQVKELVASHPTESTLNAYQYVFESPRIRTNKELRDYTLRSFTPNRDILEAAKELTERIYTDFEFDSRATTVTTPVEEVFRLRKGVCQDFAHLQIALVRSIGLPARYVSGYLRTLPPPGKPRLIGADASHAWLSVYCGTGTGWVDFDPTNNAIVSTDHITIAWARDYSDIPPLRGVFLGGGTHSLSVSVDVAPLEEVPVSS